MNNLFELEGLYDDIKCPYCGKSHFTLGPTWSTAMYCPPVIKDGKMEVNDLNSYSTECECLECGKRFSIVNGKVEKIKQYEPAVEESVVVNSDNAASINFTDLDTNELEGNFFRNYEPHLYIDLDKSRNIYIRVSGKEYQLDLDKLAALVATVAK